MKNGLWLIQEGRELAVENEMQQLHDWHVMSPMGKKELTHEQQKEALGYIMFLKCKQCGKIGGHGCMDGCKQ